MSLVVAVPLVLVLLCALMGFSGPRLVARQRRKKLTERERRRSRLIPWVHAINPDRCTGCEACVEVCPTQTLALIDHKSSVVFADRCIQCRQCAQACPTSALVMFRNNEQPPTLRMPELDRFLQTSVPGQYLIGEVSGKPLVKNAANMGRLVVEHMVATGLQPAPAASGAAAADPIDVAIVGSGPGGLSAGLTCIRHKLSHVVLEKDTLIASTIARYPQGKDFLAEPHDGRNFSLLPVFDAKKETLISVWSQVIRLTGVRVQTSVTVDTVTLQADGVFELRLAEGVIYARRVVLAIGTRGKPRTLGVPGESLVKVATMLDDPSIHRGEHVLVVGGGDTALEAAIAMAEQGAAQVTISYRGSSFARAKKKNRDALDRRIAQGKIQLLLGSRVAAIRDNDVVIQLADGRSITNDAVYVLIGADAPIKWLERAGVQYVDRPHAHPFPATDQLLADIGCARDCPTDAESAAARILGTAVAVSPVRASHHRPHVTNRHVLARGSGDAPVRRWGRHATGSSPPQSVSDDDVTRLLVPARPGSRRQRSPDPRVLLGLPPKGRMG